MTTPRSPLLIESIKGVCIELSSLFLSDGRFNFLVDVETDGVGDVGTDEAWCQTPKETFPAVAPVDVPHATTKPTIKTGLLLIPKIELEACFDDVLWVADEPAEHA